MYKWNHKLLGSPWNYSAENCAFNHSMQLNSMKLRHNSIVLTIQLYKTQYKNIIKHTAIQLNTTNGPAFNQRVKKIQSLLKNSILYSGQSGPTLIASFILQGECFEIFPIKRVSREFIKLQNCFFQLKFCLYETSRHAGVYNTNYGSN